MLHFKDFAPQELRAAALFRLAEFEPIDAAVSRAAEWLERSRVELVTVETVLLPNIYTPHEDGSTDANLSQSGDFHTSWNQIVRVWYKEA